MRPRALRFPELDALDFFARALQPASSLHLGEQPGVSGMRAQCVSTLTFFWQARHSAVIALQQAYGGVGGAVTKNGAVSYQIFAWNSNRGFEESSDPCFFSVTTPYRSVLTYIYN